MGRKYVIEIDEEHPYTRRTSHTNEEEKLYWVKGIPGLYLSEEELKYMTIYIPSDKDLSELIGKLIQRMSITEKRLIHLHSYLDLGNLVEELQYGQRISEDS